MMETNFVGGPGLLTFCTSNAGKAGEFGRLFGRPFETADLDLDELQFLDPEAVVARKAAQAYERLKRQVLVDDSAIMIHAVNGFPGAFVKWALDCGGPEMLARMPPKGSPMSADAVVSLGLADGDGVQIFSGHSRGMIVGRPRGTNGFGFDSVFQPDGCSQTLAEMSDAEKDEISPRARAIEKLKQSIF